MFSSIIHSSVWFNTVMPFIDELVLGSLALVCLVQYIFSLIRIRETTHLAESYFSLFQGLESELATTRKERILHRLEASLLRDFLREADGERAMRHLVKQFLPAGDQGFAGYLRLRPGPPHLEFQCGWKIDPDVTIEIDRAFQHQLSKGQAVHLTQFGKYGEDFWKWFPTGYRRQIQELYLLPILTGTDQKGPSALIITTHLFPVGTPPAQQLDLIERVLGAVGTACERQRSLEQHRQQLRWTGDMLELHALADQKFETPMQMIQQFLDRLRDILGVDRGSLYFGTGNASLEDSVLTPLVSSGEVFAVGIREAWQRHETRLVHLARSQAGCLTYNRRQLEEQKICSLMGTALTMPLIQNHKTIGTLCFVRKVAQPFSLEQQQLVQWAGEFLATRILRTINQVHIEREARLDGLTQLANRRTFDQQIARELQSSAETGVDCSLILVDLDHFKSVNDTYGHPAGDQVLRTTAKILMDQTQRTRTSDRTLCARYGGEELAVILPGVNAAGAFRIAEGIRRAIEASSIECDQQTLHVTASIGIASCPQHGLNTADLIAAADSALYEAKKSGRNRVLTPQGELATS